MKYKLIIDKNAEEEIIAVVHAPSSLTQQIENLVCSYSGEDYIMGYRDDADDSIHDICADSQPQRNRKQIADQNLSDSNRQ